MMHPENALVIVVIAAIAALMVGWRKLVAMTLATGLALAVVGLIQVLQL